MTMNADASLSSPTSEPCPSPEKTLRRLFLTLFLRGYSSRGLQKEKAPKSVGEKLAWTLVLYALFGMMALAFLRQPLFFLSVYLHGMTFMFLGMFIASSAGEILFNKEEADILLHRPVEPRSLLWAKVRVLVEVSLWLACAFNFAGVFVGLAAPNGSVVFPVAHVVSTMLQAMFCTGCVVMVYQLCLRWFGRERLDGLMTTAQVLISVGAVLSSQILSQMIARLHIGQIKSAPWWIGLLPPAWFAGFDDALAGSGAMGSWALAATSLVATAVVLWFSFGILARDYELGLQSLNENVSSGKRNRGRGRWMGKLVRLPFFSWWLRDPVARASFVLSSAYLFRDRDVKLRVYPALAPVLIMPIVFLVQQRPGHESGGGEFGIAFAGAYAGMVPLFGLSLLQFSQQWRAADIFRAAPIAGPAPICHGARRAVLCFLAVPAIIGFGVLGWLTQGNGDRLLLLVPGIVAMPVYALIPGLCGAMPLSKPVDEAKSAARGLSMIGITIVAAAIAGGATLAWEFEFFWYFVAAELIISILLYATLRIALNRKGWPPIE